MDRGQSIVFLLIYKSQSTPVNHWHLNQVRRVKGGDRENITPNVVEYQDKSKNICRNLTIIHNCLVLIFSSHDCQA
jgi:hypothetical protein